jgi:Holliday junction resolvase-like predicted endonuclease
VKYREQSAQGHGFDYITPTKLKQMAFAAELYVVKERYNGEYTLGALEISGPDFIVSGFIEELI